MRKKKKKLRKKIEFNFNDNFVIKLIWFDVYYKYTSVFKVYKYIDFDLKVFFFIKIKSIFYNY